jgi:hypothetical protein
MERYLGCLAETTGVHVVQRRQPWIDLRELILGMARSPLSQIYAETAEMEMVTFVQKFL